MDAQLAGICSDFYVNQKLALTMDVPEGREAVLDLFGRIKKEFPWLERLRRYEGEYALESEDVDGTYSGGKGGCSTVPGPAGGLAGLALVLGAALARRREER